MYIYIYNIDIYIYILNVLNVLPFRRQYARAILLTYLHRQWVEASLRITAIILTQFNKLRFDCMEVYGIYSEYSCIL